MWQHQSKAKPASMGPKANRCCTGKMHDVQPSGQRFPIDKKDCG